jgi:hypothetical protein
MLRDEGFDVWMDNAKLRASDKWWQSIVLALRECAAFIIIMSPESKASRWVQREVMLADEWRKPIFPVLLAGENWELFVDTHFEDVREAGGTPPEHLGKMPSKSFFDELASNVPRTSTKGADVTAPQVADPDSLDTKVIKEMSTPPPSEEVPKNNSQVKVFGVRIEIAIVAALIAGLCGVIGNAVGIIPDLIEILRPPSSALVVASSTTPTETPTVTNTPHSVQSSAVTSIAPDTPEPTVGITATQTSSVVPPTNTPTVTSISTAATVVSAAIQIQSAPFLTTPMRFSEYVLVPQGNYLGSDVSEFWIMRYEVTNAQFADYLNSRGNQSIEGRDLYNAGGSGARLSRSGGQWRVEPGFENHPTVRVSWYGARDFCILAGGRLPTAVEWQRAASWNPVTGEVTAYPWGNELPNESLANFNNQLQTNTAEVNTYSDGTSPIGAYHMSGNASEWIADTQGINRSWRGGGWDSDAASLRVDAGGTGSDTFTTASLGFRCVRNNN